MHLPKCSERGNGEETHRSIGAKSHSQRCPPEGRNRKSQHQAQPRNCKSFSGSATVRRIRACGVQVAVLVFSTSMITAGNGLQCYTTPDVCETEKGYGGGCIEDVGVAIECGPSHDTCRSVLRATEPAYYFINKTCTSNCEKQDATYKVISGRVVSETVDCCYSDLCNARNLPSLSRASLAFGAATSPWQAIVVALGGLWLQRRL